MRFTAFQVGVVHEPLKDAFHGLLRGFTLRKSDPDFFSIDPKSAKLITKSVDLEFSLLRLMSSDSLKSHLLLIAAEKLLFPVFRASGEKDDLGLRARHKTPHFERDLSLRFLKKSYRPAISYRAIALGFFAR